MAFNKSWLLYTPPRSPGRVGPGHSPSGCQWPRHKGPKEASPHQALCPDHMCHVRCSSPAGGWARGGAGCKALVSLLNPSGRLPQLLIVSVVGYSPFQKHWGRLRAVLRLAPLLRLLCAPALSSVIVGDGHQPGASGQGTRGPCKITEATAGRGCLTAALFQASLGEKCACACVHVYKCVCLCLFVHCGYVCASTSLSFSFCICWSMNAHKCVVLIVHKRRVCMCLSKFSISLFECVLVCICCDG